MVGRNTAPVPPGTGYLGRCAPRWCDHHIGYAPGPGSPHHLQDIGMNRRLPTAELDHLRLSLQFKLAVKHPLHFLKGKGETFSSVGKADRAIQVAAGIYFNESQAGMLFMLRAQAAVQGTSLLYLGTELEGHSTGLVKGRRAY